MIGFQRRFASTFDEAKKRLDRGEIGKPERLVVTSRDPGAQPPQYLKGSGGIFRLILCSDHSNGADEADTLYATGSVLVHPEIAAQVPTRWLTLAGGLLAIPHVSAEIPKLLRNVMSQFDAQEKTFIPESECRRRPGLCQRRPVHTRRRAPVRWPGDGPCHRVPEAQRALRHP